MTEVVIEKVLQNGGCRERDSSRFRNHTLASRLLFALQQRSRAGGERCHQVPPKAAPSHVRIDFMLNHSEWSDVAPGQFLNVAPEHVPWCRSRAGLWRAGQPAHLSHSKDAPIKSVHV